MDLTQDEMKKACAVAAQEVERRSENFKPKDKPVIKDEEAWVCEQVYLGSALSDLMCSIKLQWNYRAAGVTGRVCEYVHVKLCCIVKDGDRYLRLTGLHVAAWKNEPGGARCRHCDEDFNEHVVVQADTSLWEY